MLSHACKNAALLESCETTTTGRSPRSTHPAANAASAVVLPEPGGPTRIATSFVPRISACACVSRTDDRDAWLARKGPLPFKRPFAACQRILAKTARRVVARRKAQDAVARQEIAALQERREGCVEIGRRTGGAHHPIFALHLRRSGAIRDEIEREYPHIVLRIANGDKRYSLDVVARRSAHRIVQSELRFFARAYFVEVGTGVRLDAPRLIVVDRDGPAALGAVQSIDVTDEIVVPELAPFEYLDRGDLHRRTLRFSHEPAHVLLGHAPCPPAG